MQACPASCIRRVTAAAGTLVMGVDRQCATYDKVSESFKHNPSPSPKHKYAPHLVLVHFCMMYDHQRQQPSLHPVHGPKNACMRCRRCRFPFIYRFCANGHRSSPTTRPLVWDLAHRECIQPPADGCAYALLRTPSPDMAEPANGSGQSMACPVC